MRPAAGSPGSPPTPSTSPSTAPGTSPSTAPNAPSTRALASGLRARRRGLFRLAVPAVILALGLLAAAALVAPRLLPPMPAAHSGPLAGMRLEPAFPRLSFERPLYLTWAPDGTDRVYVVEQQGRIHRFPNRADVTETEPFLDITSRVTRRGNEEGLLGLAFHPAFGEAGDPGEGLFYVYYSARERGPRSVLAELRLGPDGRGDPASERVLLEVPQPWRNHNGGMIEFGPDGMLYVGLGDGGAAGDPRNHGQDKGTLLGTILRLDVSRRDPGRAYAIPPDNPFTSIPGARGELWAFGLRNPWRFSFDRATGALWTGDVGQNAWEEVHTIERGGNYGWRAYEGFAVYDRRLDVPDAIPPLAAYGRREGISITGGYVYRGPSLPELTGKYLYADFGTGAVWALARDADAGPAPDHAPAPGSDPLHPAAPGVRVTKIVTAGPPIASFGEDRAGEVYLCAFDGKIYRLARAEAAPGRR